MKINNHLPTLNLLNKMPASETPKSRNSCRNDVHLVTYFLQEIAHVSQVESNELCQRDQDHDGDQDELVVI